MMFRPKMIIAGASAYPREWDYARIHKSLRGPRAGMIFFRRGPKSDAEGAPKYEYEEAINFAVFPSLQGGPHNHQIAGLATQLKEVATPEFKAYAKQIRANAQALAKFLIGKGYKL